MQNAHYIRKNQILEIEYESRPDFCNLHHSQTEHKTPCVSYFVHILMTENASNANDLELDENILGCSPLTNCIILHTVADVSYC